MHQKSLWRDINGFLLVLVILFYVAEVQCYDTSASSTGASSSSSASSRASSSPSASSRASNTPSGSTTQSRTTISDSTSSEDEATATTTYYRKPTKKTYYSKYGQDYAGYGSYEDDYRSSGNKGIDFDTYGQDMADQKDIYEDKDSMSASLYVWIRSADKWDRPDKDNYKRNRYNKNRYDKDSKKKYSKNDAYKGKDYKDKDYKGKDYKGKDDYDRKDKYERVAFPVRYYKDYKKVPIRRFPPLFATFPWTSIFYDKITYQTIISSPAGGFIILPPLINFFGQRFAVAQLIKWGYASLVSTGLPPGPGFNVDPLIQTPGVPGGPAPAQLPYNPQNGQFNGGVTTRFSSFKPRGY